jgi:hypothetical protein
MPILYHYHHKLHCFECIENIFGCGSARSVFLDGVELEYFQRCTLRVLKYNFDSKMVKFPVNNIECDELDGVNRKKVIIFSKLF